jgi:hypothetical protein
LISSLVVAMVVVTAAVAAVVVVYEREIINSRCNGCGGGGGGSGDGCECGGDGGDEKQTNGRGKGWAAAAAAVDGVVMVGHERQGSMVVVAVTTAAVVVVDMVYSQFINVMISVKPKRAQELSVMGVISTTCVCPDGGHFVSSGVSPLPRFNKG